MKKIRLTVAILTLSVSGAMAQGTDAFGYIAKNNTQAGGPALEWVDISARPSTVTVGGLGDDNGTALIPLGFSFPYYFSEYSGVALGVNGWISFNDKTVLSPPFDPIPSTRTKASNFIAAYASDLNFDGPGNPGKMMYWTNNTDSFVVTYDKVPFWQMAAPGYYSSNTFQIILSRKDTTITINYKDVTLPTGGGGAGAVTQAGIENLTGKSGLLLFSSSTPPAKTYKFYFPRTTTLKSTDVTTQWTQYADNGGTFVLQGTTPITLKANVQNVGNTTAKAIVMTASTKKGSITKTITPNITIDSLVQGKDSTVTITSSFVAETAGSYTFTVSSKCTSDEFINNNGAISEIIAVSAVGNSKLNYATDMENFGGGSFGLVGDSSGAAVYIIPPYYPATVTEVEAFMIDAAGSPDQAGELLPGGFRAIIFDDNGANGLPGTKLATVIVPEEETSSFSKHNARLVTPLTITSGGFYVAIFTDSTNVQVAAETAGPFSGRTFEIIGGAASPYRNGDAEEFQLGAVTTQTVGIAATPKAIRNALSQNYPNPAKDITTVSYKVEEGSNVKFVVTNLLGQVVETISLGNVSYGVNDLRINTANYSEGVYSYTLLVNEEPMSSKKMIVIK